MYLACNSFWSEFRKIRTRNDSVFGRFSCSEPVIIIKQIHLVKKYYDIIFFWLFLTCDGKVKIQAQLTIDSVIFPKFCSISEMQNIKDTYIHLIFAPTISS